MSFDVPATPVEIVKVGHSALGNGTRSVTEDVGDPMLAQHLHSLMMFQRLAIANGYGWQLTGASINLLSSRPLSPGCVSAATTNPACAKASAVS